MPAPSQLSPPRKAPSQSTLMLILGGICMLSLPLMLIWPDPQPPVPAGTLTLQAPPPQRLSADGSLKLDALVASVEREPLNVPAADLEGSWSPSLEADGLLLAVQALSDDSLSDEALADVLARGLAAPSEPPPGSTVAPTGGGNAVSAYLQEMEFALMSGGFWQDPQQLGMQVVQELMGGDVSGLGQLRGSNDAVLRRVQAIQPPPGCEEHHRLTMQVIQTGNALLTEWSGAIAQGDIDVIASATARAESLRHDAAKVDALTEQLRQEAR